MTNIKSVIKDRAIALRKLGYLYSHIAKELHIPRSTAYTWTQGIELTVNEQLLVDARRREVHLRAVKTMTDVRRAAAAARDDLIATEAKRIVDSVDIKGPYGMILCAALFWCEGQTSTESGVKFINSDPQMVRLFMKLLRENFDVDESRLRALVHLHDYHNEQKQLVYWSGVTGIPLRQFYKSYRKPHTGKNKREGYPGCISVRYGDAALGKKLKMIYSNLGEIA